jgi:putative nucleotidyltransferase with HDIG domain
MKSKAIQTYVAFVVLMAAAILGGQDWSVLTQFPWVSVVGFLALVVLGVLSESWALTITVGRSAGGSSITFLPLLASILLFGPTAAVLFMLVTGLVGEVFIRKKEKVRAVFNVAQYVVSTAAGGWAFTAVGGYPIAPTGALSPPSFAPQFIPFIAFGAVFLSVNHLAVSFAIALSQDLPFRRVWLRLIGRSGTNMVYDLALSPVAIGVAYLYVEFWVFGLFLFFWVLFFIRHLYATNLRLQQTNRDLVRALVKAIETRDPYTSGHSLRVSSLARRIAEGCGLSPRRVEWVETAALLHDIGKIEAVFTEILMKPTGLSREEREIIESHVTKGVELLSSISSFPDDVIDAVQHHHETYDGRGYPYGLRGEQIPIGARIISACDAIDAMLSDRPYRRALDLPEVRRQLIAYSGSQFDPNLVEVILRDDLLEAHAAELRQDRDLGRQERPSLDVLREQEGEAIGRG